MVTMRDRRLDLNGYIAVLAIISIAAHLILPYVIPDNQVLAFYPLYLTK